MLLLFSTKNVSKKLGFSLVELMIAAVISLLLMAGMITLYLSCQQNYRLQQSLMSMQDNARLALHLLENEIRTAGYIGCPRFDTDFYQANFSNQSNYEFSPQTIIQGFYGYGQQWQPKLPKHLRSVVKANSDALIIKKFSTQAAQVLELDNNSKKISLLTKSRMKKNQVIILGDCNKAEMLVIKNVSRRSDRQIITLKNKWRQSYDAFATVSPLRIKRFFIKKTQRLTRLGKPIFALYQEGMNGRDEELVSGISGLRLYFAERVPSSDLKFKKSSEIIDWQHVVAVKVDLLLVSDEEVARQLYDYQFSGQSFHAKDRRLRRQWSTVVALRMRV